MGITGKYYAHIGKEPEELVIPIIISNKEEDLYNACSPLHAFESSLTFKRGAPIDHDVHGAEATLAGYVALGTHVAYIPESLEYEGKFAKPPWAARLFIHKGKNENNEVSFVPQPAYAIDRVLAQLLQDAVDWILYFTSDTLTYASCTSLYEGIYVDIGVRRPILKTDLYDIAKYWQNDKFVLRVKN
jgi:hypothetical protein